LLFLRQNFPLCRELFYSVCPMSTATTELDADQEDGFEDYSHASPWERLEATLEDSLAQWVAAGPSGLVDGVHADNTCVGRKVGLPLLTTITY
jgi:hypothetical protein